MTANVLAVLPKKRKSEAGKMLGAMSNAGTRVDAKKLRDRFVKRCGVRCAGAGELVCADWKQLTNFQAFPSDHWPQLRTAGVLEAPLTALRLRAAEPVSCIHAPDVDAVLWKLMSAATRNFRRLSAPHLLASDSKPGVQVEESSRARSRVRSA